MRFFETHAHLNDPRFDLDRAEVVDACLASGVGRIVEIADSPAEWAAAVSLSRAYPGHVLCSLGLHPYHAGAWEPGLAPRLKEAAAAAEVVAVGEIGLDYAKAPDPPEVQERALRGMLEAVRGLGLPVVIHCREAYHDMMPLLEEYATTQSLNRRFRGVLHCFSGSREEALAAVRLGFALGVDGPVTYPKNDGLREALTAAGLDNLVLETDSPYLPPQSARGRRNDPRALREIAAKVAELYGIGPAEVAERTWRNAEDLFRRASA